MLRVPIVSAMALLLFAGPALAQEGSITGSVTSAETGTPVAAAQVRVIGTQAAVITNDDGRYTIRIQPGTYTLRVSRLGFLPDSLTGLIVVAGEQTTANFQLQSSAAILSAIVTVGYGTTEARARTGSVETVTSEDFNTGRVVSAEQLIQSKVPGVQVVDNGEPGGGLAIRIRGGTSVTSSNEPLFVIDGVPIAIGGGISVGRNPLNFLNPDDIEKVTVLKDASATAIYGSRGANGVILIETRSGATGPRFEYSSSLSTSRIIAQPDLLNAAEFRSAVETYADFNLSKLGTANTDWRSAIMRSGVGEEHQLAVSGTRDDMRYRLSLGYLDQQGIVQGSDVKRLSGSLNYVDRVLEDRLTVRSVIMGTRTEDWFQSGGVLGAATAMAPTQPILNPDGTYFEWADPLGPNNPMAELALTHERGTMFRSIGKLEGEYSLPFLQPLTGTMRVGYDVSKGERTNFYPSTLQWQMETGLNGQFTRSNPSLVNTVLEIFGNHQRSIDALESSLDLTAGYSYEESRGEFPSFTVEQLDNDLMGPNGIPAGTPRLPSYFVDESKLASFFMRANYSMRDRYLFTLSVRRDGSSKFGPQEQWGTFPAVAFAWRIIDEPFLATFDALSDLKLRVSWGVNGNQAIPNYLAWPRYQFCTNTAQVQFGDEFVCPVRPDAADPNIKWEETASTNVGLDFGILNNRFSGAIDYYFKKTDDLLFLVPVAAGSNLSNFLLTNIGSVENRGLELNLNATIFDRGRRGFRWDANINAATNRNKLTQINAFSEGVERILTGGISGGVGNTIQVLQPGQPVNTFFVYRHKLDANGNPIYSDNALDMYVDQNNDGIINQDDRVPYKSPEPKWILGHTSSMGYGNVELTFTMRAYMGNYVYNNVASNLGHYSAVRLGAPVNLHRSVLTNEFVQPQYFSDVYVEDASFLRMDNLSLSYTFQQVRNIENLRVFGVVQNVFTVTKYSGSDPLAGVNGIDNNLYPFARTFTVGAGVGF